MPGGTDRQVFCKAFNQAEDEGLQNGHGGSSCTPFYHKGQTKNEKEGIKEWHQQKKIAESLKTCYE